MVLFTAMGFVTKATEKFSGSYKSPPNGDLKIEVTCSASGRKTTLVKSPHACKCPVQKEVLYPPVEKVIQKEQREIIYKTFIFRFHPT